MKKSVISLKFNVDLESMHIVLIKVSFQVSKLNAQFRKFI